MYLQKEFMYLQKECGIGCCAAAAEAVHRTGHWQVCSGAPRG